MRGVLQITVDVALEDILLSTGHSCDKTPKRIAEHGFISFILSRTGLMCGDDHRSIGDCILPTVRKDLPVRGE